MNNPQLPPSNRFLSAFEFAFELHRDQFRKGTGIPYISHIMGVTALVLQDGGDETEAIAALLHDTVEDQGGHETLDTIKDAFGVRVAALVEFCTDSMETPKPPWKKRKLTLIERAKKADQSELKIFIADKLHNLRSIRHSLQVDGEEVWGRFRGGRDGSLWYYRQMLHVFQERINHPYVDEMAVILDLIEKPD